LALPSSENQDVVRVSELSTVKSAPDQLAVPFVIEQTIFRLSQYFPSHIIFVTTRPSVQSLGPCFVCSSEKYPTFSTYEVLIAPRVLLYLVHRDVPIAVA